MDFTLKTYYELLTALKGAGYEFLTFKEYCEGKRCDKFVILRHDVDLLPMHSFNFAILQAEIGVRGSYYFRAVPESWDESVIQGIDAMNHEIGYHYENMTTCNGQVAQAVKDFQKNLKELNKLSDVKTICMHGSPRSKYDSKDLWNDNNYRDFEIIGEPYFDADFDDLFYLTDTGRRWDGWKVSVRDKVPQQSEWEKQGLVFHNSSEIIKAIQTGQSLSGVEMPKRIMFTFHPQRWHHNPVKWTKELLLQNMKNVVKRVLVKC